MSRWTLLRTRTIYHNPIATLVEECRQDPRSRNEVPFFVLKFPDWVNVVPVTEDGHVVLVRQYRAGMNAATLEIPGGTLDEGETDPAEAARRELLEETGHAAQEFIYLGRVVPNPAIQGNFCHFYLAPGARRVGPQHLDPTEEISLEVVKIEDVRRMIADGEIVHALGILGLLYALKYLEAEEKPDR
ncbi:MAG TPA: NUDIX hydrolase [Bacillota bacterium]|jgi:8-oxo-dGTP pyrophosphatase MutT (NUDIX family)